MPVNVSRILNQIAVINAECFTSDDPYSSPECLKNFLTQNDVGVAYIRHERQVVGFILYSEFNTHIESLRRAVTKKHRGLGNGLKLSKRLIALANKKGKDIYTYVAKTNLISLNSNLKVGYKIENIGKDWVYIRYNRR